MSRIIAGSRRGRRLAMPAGGHTRPTTDRVREALFSAVVAWAGRAAAPAETALVGLGFADLFAGSGAVGLEAASRGASPVLAVEADRRTAATLRRNVAELGLVVTVRTARVEQLLADAPAEAYRVVFADPPYGTDAAALDRLLGPLVDGWLARDGLAVVERASRSAAPTWPDGLGRTWSRRYGETTLHFAQR